MNFLIFILCIFAFYGISYYLKRRVIPKIKGSIGEYKVSSKLNRLNKKEYIVLNDLLLKTTNSTTQIDHIVICKSGIFVIETKYYKGWIFGHENAKYWTQIIFKYKTKLNNPIKQNWVHTYAIKNLFLEFNNINYYPIVVFAGSGKLKRITSSLPVIQANKLLKTIKSTNNIESLSYDQMKLISDKLKQHNILDRNQRKSHPKQVKYQIRRRKRMEELKICPNCGATLIKKKGKYGNFYGCQNFPKCKYTLNIH